MLALLSLFRYAWCRSSGTCCYVHTPFASFQFGEDAHALERFAGLRSQRACAAVRPEQALTRKHYSEEVHWAARPSDFYDDAVRAEQ